MFMDELVGETRGPSTPAVSVEDVTKRYPGRVAVEKLSLTVLTGEVLGLVGANGGGKTTTLRILAGILRPDQGQGQVLGIDLMRGTREIRERVGYMSQRFSLYADLSVFENLRFRAEVYGLERPRAVAEAAICDFELSDYARSAAGQLSGGWARRLQLAVALIHSPRLILLDEPTAGLDVASRQEVWRRISRLATQGAGIIVSTHDLAEAERCSRVALLADGRIVTVGTPQQIARRAPAAAFVLSGDNARLLARCVETVTGVIASYPQGPCLRIVADAQAEEGLHRVASINHVSLASSAMRLEDAVLALSAPRNEG
jgi:ABC-2 type transport system ATP-binding protein